MSIRATNTSDADQTVLRIDGRLMSEDVAELVRHYGAAENPSVLDLSNLQSADSDGVTLIREFVCRGAQIRGASPYIELLLRGEP
jgi:ABC-type transporter Mla MlaB component